MRLILIALTALTLAACSGAPAKVLSSLVIVATGHDIDGNAPIADEKEEYVAPSVEANSSSVYVPPPGEPCEPGSKQTRVWDCVDGFRSYW